MLFKKRMLLKDENASEKLDCFFKMRMPLKNDNAS